MDIQPSMISSGVSGREKRSLVYRAASGALWWVT